MLTFCFPMVVKYEVFFRASYDDLLVPYACVGPRTPERSSDSPRGGPVGGSSGGPMLKTEDLGTWTKAYRSRG